jgi:hypothetical protein
MSPDPARVAPDPPAVRLSLAITGHREDHPLYAANRARIEATLKSAFDAIDAAIAETPSPYGAPFAPTRLHTLLAGGADQAAARVARARAWEVHAPLPFGRELYAAIIARASSAADVHALLDGRPPSDAAAARRADDFYALSKQSLLFELADDDEDIRAALLSRLEAPSDQKLGDLYAAKVSARVALAARLMIEQSDILIAVWDGESTLLVGGTGHTVATALQLGSDVIWIDPAAPEAWRILRAPEALSSLRAEASEMPRAEQLRRIVQSAIAPAVAMSAHGENNGEYAGIAALDASRWRKSSSPLWHAYRRVEAVFGGEKGRNPWRSLRQIYEPPEAIAAGSAAGVLAATGALPDHAFAARVGASVLARFAWADGLSSHMSDAYRGGMIINFIISALAVAAGVVYLPLVDADLKWPFALAEFALLAAILTITHLGQKRRWHGRWFETRRVAEYLRHAHLLLALGTARPPGRWPRGAATSWPEHYARHALREVGLPRARITPAYLRHALRELLDRHVTVQRDYHAAKAKKLSAVHHHLDQLSNALFQIAVASVAVYLAMVLGEKLGLVAHKVLDKSAKVFTVLGVLLPTFGGAIAGARYFGDFERFAAISETTAAKLEVVHDRIQLLLQAPDAAMDYGPVADLAHAADDIVHDEIESWQAVFSGKRITVPV